MFRIDETSGGAAPPSLPASAGEEDIVRRVHEAVMDQRLPPGTKLSEAALCEAFGVGRMRVRRSLLLLASRSIVDLHSNRGAFVASPTAAQAREVFEARRMIEPGVVRLAAVRRSEADLARLAAHLAGEESAHRDGERRQAIGLSGQFHIRLAELSANHVMERIVAELVARTSLIIGMYGAPGTANCHSGEHAEILAALAARAADRAADLVVAHLRSIEAQVDLEARKRPPVDLVSLFG